MAKKLTPAQIEALVADYESWNQYDENDPTTADMIAARHGVSKQTMYNYLTSRKRGTAAQHTAQEVADLQKRLAEAQEAILFLTGELMVAKAALAARQDDNGYASAGR